jgi:hypothetical protein
MDQVRSTVQILSNARLRQQIDLTIPGSLPTPIPKLVWKRYAKSHGKAKQRMMTGTEVAIKDADKHEKEEARLQKATEQIKQKEAMIDDDLLAGMATEEDLDSDNSETREIVFSTPIHRHEARCYCQ